MQVVVRRNDLTNETPYVVASYDDALVVDVTALGLTPDAATVLTVPATAITRAERMPPMLAPNWRDNGQLTTNAEAFRRIEQSFSSYAQRNANADMIECVTKYGNDPATWPQDARERKTLADQGWAYVNNVRQQANALAVNMPVDVTDDSHWPTQIPRISYPTT